jgi:4'-phosphopantetheinyl transferase
MTSPDPCVDAADTLCFARIDSSGGPLDTGDCVLADGDVDVWAFSLAAHPRDIAQWSLLLCDDECQCAGRFMHAADRDAYVVAHGVVRRLLACYSGIAPGALKLGRTAGGKPVQDEPLGGHALRFNLAHSGDGALLAVSRSCEVGVDLEVARTEIDMLSVAARFFDEAEREAVAGTPDALRADVFFRYWVAKEAALKAQGCGLAYPLDGFAIRFSETGSTASVISKDTVAMRSDWLVRMLPMPLGWYGALCAPRDCTPRLRRYPAHAVVEA